MKTFNNSLTDAQSERLHLLAEECAEVIQAVTKVLRHGYQNYNPANAPTLTTNREELATEIGHVMHAVDRLTLQKDINRELIDGATAEKATNVERWLRHQHKEVPLQTAICRNCGRHTPNMAVVIVEGMRRCSMCDGEAYVL